MGSYHRAGGALQYEDTLQPNKETTVKTTDLSQGMIGIEENAPTAIVLQRVTKQTMAVQKLSIQFPLQI